MNIIKGFRDFIFRGNVLDMAVGIVIGAAFGTVVNALVKDILLPIVGVVFRVPDFSSLYFVFGGTIFMYGDFLNAVISFLAVAAGIYFFVIVPLGEISRLKKSEERLAPTTMKCPECLVDIPAGAKRCPFCTSQLS